MKKIEMYEGPIQAIFVGLLIVALGVLAGWFFHIATTLTLFFIVVILVGYLVWDLKKNTHIGTGDGALGIFFVIMPAVAIFVIVATITGMVVHWNDLLYLLCQVFR